MAKYKKGKGFKCRRQQKVYRRKSGGSGFMVTGAPVLGSYSPEREKSIILRMLEAAGFIKNNPTLKMMPPNKPTPNIIEDI